MLSSVSAICHQIGRVGPARKLVCIAALLASSMSHSAPDVLPQAGYREVVLSVRDIGQWAQTMTDLGGWAVVAEGAVDRRQLSAWGLAETVSAREAVMRNPLATRGEVRLIQFNGIEQDQIRSGAQSWDTGGWFDFNVRVADLASQQQQLQRLGWQATSDPVRFTFGPFEVIEWLPRGPDGVVLALIERIKPVLTGWPDVQRGMSRAFNATQIVTDISLARAFYEDVLGFKPYLEHSGASREPGPNVLGLPHNLAAEITRHVVILHPQGVNEGSVELIEFAGLTGTDYSARAIPPNLGILMLRFPVSDVQAFAETMRAKGVALAYEPTTVALPPHGPVAIVGLRGPGGALLEFFSTE